MEQPASSCMRSGGGPVWGCVRNPHAGSPGRGCPPTSRSPSPCTRSPSSWPTRTSRGTAWARGVPARGEGVRRAARRLPQGRMALPGASPRAGARSPARPPWREWGSRAWGIQGPSPGAWRGSTPLTACCPRNTRKRRPSGRRTPQKTRTPGSRPTPTARPGRRGRPSLRSSSGNWRPNSPTTTT
ncbi:hypothetical protein ANANG_G00290770 [Anguilla anguilla]|uniref:Uncharacterized protein n=1 Tax=Anguilla anguilla TaxID=7936 RepID=A0A9D3LK04_ANGAN|nr:hypothetical protein ANANG_G00290770 [Anguilla anguilla]